MTNIIEEAKRKAGQRLAREQSEREQAIAKELAARQAREQEIQANILFNQTFFEEAQLALVETGIVTTLQELALDLTGRSVPTRISTSNLDLNSGDNHQYRNGTRRAKWAYVELTWLSAVQKSRTNGGTDNKWEKYRVSVIYHSNGKLEFKSAVGDNVLVNPEEGITSGIRSQVLTPEEWSTNKDLVASYLEAAYKSPFVFIETSWEPDSRDSQGQW